MWCCYKELFQQYLVLFKCILPCKVLWYLSDTFIRSSTKLSGNIAKQSSSKPIKNYHILLDLIDASDNYLRQYLDCRRYHWHTLKNVYSIIDWFIFKVSEWKNIICFGSYEYDTTHTHIHTHHPFVFIRVIRNYCVQDRRTWLNDQSSTVAIWLSPKVSQYETSYQQY